MPNIILYKPIENRNCRHQILATSTLETRPSLSFLILRRAYVPGPWLEVVNEFLIVESYANLSPGDPARVDDHTVLNLPHEVAQVGGEKQQMWRPGTISYKKKLECEKEKTCASWPCSPIVQSLRSSPQKADRVDRKTPGSKSHCTSAVHTCEIVLTWVSRWEARRAIRSPDLGGKLISSLPRWKRMSDDVIPMFTPLTLIVEGSDTYLMLGKDFSKEAVAESTTGKGGWKRKW